MVYRLDVESQTVCNADHVCQDTKGKVIIEANGRYIGEALSGMFLMRKEPVFDAAYGAVGDGLQVLLVEVTLRAALEPARS